MIRALLHVLVALALPMSVVAQCNCETANITSHGTSYLLFEHYTNCGQDPVVPPYSCGGTRIVCPPAGNCGGVQDINWNCIVGQLSCKRYDYTCTGSNCDPSAGTNYGTTFNSPDANNECSPPEECEQN